MTLNPLIELARDPVAFFGALGYLSLLVAVLYVGVGYAIQGFVAVYADWLQNRERPKWARLWGDGVGYIPTGENALRLFVSLLACTAAFWSVGALVWFAGGGV